MQNILQINNTLLKQNSGTVVTKVELTCLEVLIFPMIYYLQYSLDSDARDFYNKRIAPVKNSLPSYHEALERICTEPRYAVAMSSRYIQSLQAAKKLNCTVIGVPQTSFPEDFGMPIAKGCPFIRILNHKYVTSFQFSCTLFLILFHCNGQTVFVGCFIDEDVTDRFSRKFCKKLPFNAA
jgi:hypothetical protein